MWRLLRSSLLQLGRRGSPSLLPPGALGSFGVRPRTVSSNHAYSTGERNATKSTERFPLPKEEDLPNDIAELMKREEAKRGFLPNVLKVMSHRPVELRAFLAYFSAVVNKETGNLSMADKELIIVATSVANKVPYCAIAHGALHRMYSKKPVLADQITVNWKMADLSDRELAMLDFALAVCRADTITKEHFQKLEAHGFDREDAWDIGAISAFFAMANRIAQFTDMQPNLEYYTMGRTLREKEKTK
ncbi:XP_028568729.1uncharacterized protein LOC114587984 isoform X1 [Podarcis lilfordi]|uniref:XP_028568729.1uncharacterized protein LOC114587984 isoform X1 n=1 Tax=Podarcis lilfordi TaxID=74358 RepID=A0AA35LJB9_9SAUR|nr:XP_028568729.1uncharacterized protein LOC114587984 isoform X1 [Podarcis lilfordi]